jgi:predicted nucleotide-binding protein
MEKIKLIEHLMDMLTHLPYRDKETLLTFRKHADQMITDLFGKESHYHNDLEKIRFLPQSFYSTEEDYLESWRLGIETSLKLFQQMLVELGAGEEPSKDVPVVPESSHEPLEVPRDKSESLYPDVSSREAAPSTDSAPSETHPEKDSLEKKKETPSETFLRNPLEDYLLEVEFSHGHQTTNLDEAQNWGELTKEDTTQKEKTRSPTKTEPSSEAPAKTPEQGEKSKVEQLQAVIEKLQKSRIKEGPLDKIERKDGTERNLTTSSSNLGVPSNQAISVQEEVTFPRVAPPILVVYGHHEVMKDEALLVLEKLGLQAILSAEERKEGLTVFKRFSQPMPTDVSFAIVILSGDDFVYSKDQNSDEARLRPRQSVIFDLGFLVGKLGRDRVFVLYQDTRDFELPTDFFDVLYTPYSKIGGWQLELLRQLKKAGYPVDANKLI